MYLNKHDTVEVEPEDQCITCEHLNKGISCPLLEALALKVVTLNHETEVQNCGFYKPFERNLKLI